MQQAFKAFPLLKPGLGAGLQEALRSPTPCFALLKVGGEVVDDELDALSQTCAFLSLAGLNTAVVHGGGPQMNKELAKRTRAYWSTKRLTHTHTTQAELSPITSRATE
jgi:acetylglutamate kinase